ncbi:radical SAM protein [Candidatus Woesearchaeota archaeon]|nr:radical SAM protein [Candidatus Woesearchaeota archaeon]
MKVTLLEIKKAGDNKDFNGGFGTAFQVGNSIRSKLLQYIRAKSESFPTMSYTYIAAIFKMYNHSVGYYVNDMPKSSDILLMHVSLIRHKEEVNFLKRLKGSGLKNIGVYGPLASVKPELFKDADFIIVGEPENAILNICKNEKIPQGIVYSNPVMDLDALPFPDWSIFNVNEYSFSPVLPLKPCVFVLASRGCPYKCSYCPYRVFGTHRVRRPEKVVEEFIYLKESYGIKACFFRDPTFSINQKNIEKLANLMVINKLNIRWGCETKLDLLTIPLLKLLYASGLRALKVGIESLDHNLLKKHGRNPPNIIHQEEIIRFCKKIGIKVIAFYIVGLPDDGKESIHKMIKYSRKLNTSFANFTVCTPIPGTSFYDEMKDKIFDFDLNHYDNFHIVFKHENLTKEEILNYQEKAINEYYFRLRFIFRYIIDKLNTR